MFFLFDVRVNAVLGGTSKRVIDTGTAFVYYSLPLVESLHAIICVTSYRKKWRLSSESPQYFVSSESLQHFVKKG